MVTNISPAALKRLQVLYRQADARFDIGSSREDRLRWASLGSGRPVASFSDLTPDEGKHLIDALQASLNIPETAPSIRQRRSRHQKEKEGTEGRNDQLHPELTILTGSEDIFRKVQLKMTELGMDKERLQRFLASSQGPLAGRTAMRTLYDANRVYWALKRMATGSKSKTQHLHPRRRNSTAGATA